MVSRVGVLVHRRKGISTERAPGRREPGVVGARRSRVRITRRTVEVMLVRRPQGSVAVLLQFDERTLRNGRRIVRFVGCWRSDVALARHCRRARWIFVWTPERGAQIREVQRRERFVVHFGEVLVRGVRSAVLTALNANRIDRRPNATRSIGSE